MPALLIHRGVGLALPALPALHLFLHQLRLAGDGVVEFPEEIYGHAVGEWTEDGLDQLPVDGHARNDGPPVSPVLLYSSLDPLLVSELP